MTSDKNVQRWWNYSDVLCILACLGVLVMSLLSYLGTSRIGYQVNTGVFCGLFLLIPMLLKRFHIVTLPPVFVVAIVIAVILHAYGVLLLSYDMLPYYDTITHFISSVVVALCVFYTLMCYHTYAGGGSKFVGRGLPIAIALIMLGFSAYWEVFEYIVDILTGTTMQYSPFDTLRDMVCNTCGTIAVAAVTGWYMRSKDPKVIADSFALHPRLKAFISDPFNEKKQNAGKQQGNE